MADKWLNLFRDAKRSRVESFIDGQEYFSAVIAAIETTKTEKDYIYILGWMLDVGFDLGSGKTLFKLLEKAAKLKVEIRILIWDNIDPDYVKTNAEAVQKLNALKLSNLSIFLDRHTFAPAKSKKFVLDLANDAIALITGLQSLFVGDSDLKSGLSWLIDKLKPFTLNPSICTHHEKVVIVKAKGGLTSFCGGIDFNKNRVIAEVSGKEQRFPYYHDTACKVQGPAAYEVLQKFKLRWSNHPQAKSVLLLGEKESKPKECPAPAPYVKVVGTYNSPDGAGKPDRTLKEAYLKIIDNAKSHIYIEDQYLVNLDVAKALNKKIQDSKFEKLTLAIQASSETQDVLIPFKKRGEFLNAVLAPAASTLNKLCVAVIDKSDWEKNKYHPGLHAKTLIVDDEIAIIGSANVNQRSFTYDSETSLVLFNDGESKKNFAAGVRRKILTDFLRVKSTAPGKDDPDMFAAQGLLPTIINAAPTKNAFILNSSIDKNVFKTDHLDLDDKMIQYLNNISIKGLQLAWQQGRLSITVKGKQIVNFVISEDSIHEIFEILWQNIIDPTAP